MANEGDRRSKPYSSTISHDGDSLKVEFTYVLTGTKEEELQLKGLARKLSLEDITVHPSEGEEFESRTSFRFEFERGLYLELDKVAERAPYAIENLITDLNRYALDWKTNPVQYYRELAFTAARVLSDLLKSKKANKRKL